MIIEYQQSTVPNHPTPYWCRFAAACTIIKNEAKVVERMLRMLVFIGLKCALLIKKNPAIIIKREDATGRDD
jgi:hypothetical protein